MISPLSSRVYKIISSESILKNKVIFSIFMRILLMCKSGITLILAYFYNRTKGGEEHAFSNIIFMGIPIFIDLIGTCFYC